MTLKHDVLSQTELPTALVETIPNAIIAPVMPDEPLRYGVFQVDESHCQIASTRLGGGRFSGVADYPDCVSQKMKGRYLFGGLARLHFGHFLLESLPRLWALDDIQDDIDGIIFLHHPKHNLRPAFKRTYAALYSAIGQSKPFHLVTQTTEVETLYVPSQGFGHNEWSTGTATFRNYVRGKCQSQFTPRGPDKLYVSRSQLSKRLPRVDQEERIVQLMEAAGYSVFHPQQHSVSEQCEHYLAAKQVVGGDGSAFHLGAFCFQPGCHVGLIQRRNRPEVYNAILNQIRSFSDADVIPIDPLTYEAPPSGTLEEPIDFDRLQRALSAAGFLD
ncbi:hypothetical protein ROA7450_00588 [Roseovarius albus]|uniref:Glycosyltransferase 61 catalytic domain-containing protein n=1 Tax=Roseovarius albus TaxID=1247867 RepID=A0A1X6YGF5_9RHOB|nr:glycosyltransferase 61 family protein [Roseovarius albus]SLN18706.1 hypothetical protein ROA7450_00588 [Roseovarius albus]